MSEFDEYNAPEVVETLRRTLNALPRYSFLLDNAGNVRRVPDRYGKWIEWDQAHALLDWEAIASLVAKERAKAAIAQAQRSGDEQA